MTAEIAVLNKHGVALASDSAVTISHAQGDKVFNSVNKLFTMSKYAPVGVMVYGDADFMDVPWEPLIKVYRSQLGKKRFATIEAYAADFARFLERHRLFSDKQREASAFGRRVAQFFGLQHARISDAIARHAKGNIPSPAMEREAVDEVLKWEEEHLKHHQRLPRLPSNCVTKRRRLVQQAMDAVFRGLTLTAREKRRLFSVFERQFLSDYMPHTTGVVVAGYGEEEIYPALISMELDGVYDRRLRHVSEPFSISDTTTSGLIPFAQYDMVSTFMRGIDPQLAQALDSSLNTVLSALPADDIANRLKLTPKQRRELAQTLKSVGDVVIQMFRQSARKFQGRYHYDPVMTALAHVPKEELAELAESLVHLTSLKRRVALETETVGGPIDVAVISKGDGFIWLKRKHYFRPELNPYFIATYYNKEET